MGRRREMAKSCTKTSRLAWRKGQPLGLAVRKSWLLGWSAAPTGFVREIPKRTIKTFDLVDVVAGGDGFSGRRGHGIDPTNGRPTDRTPKDPDRG